jgi:hypothetical protein
MAKRKSTVENQSQAHQTMMVRWAKVNALLGGTETMRAMGEAYLPKHQEEDFHSWQRRLARSVLTNIFKRVIKSLSGRPFTEEIILENFPDRLEELSKDVNKQGDNINIFARDVFQDGLAKGFTGILVDFPTLSELNEDNTIRTLADEIRNGISPYFCHVKPESIIAMYSTIVNGVELLTHIRIREDTVEREGEFEEKLVERIRVMEPGVWVLWEKVKVSSRKEEWKVVGGGETNLPFVPIVFFYADRQALGLSDPPLMDIANLNMAHWQSASDQRHILTVARFPILASSGVVDIGTIAVGPNEHLNTPDTQGRFYYVEHSGAAIEAGRNDLKDLEEDMVTLAMEPLLRKAGNVTATQRAIDAAEGHSELQNMAMKFSETLTIAFKMAGMWLSLDLPDEMRALVYTEFGPTSQESKDIDQLIQMRANNDISRESFYQELQRRNFLDINFDIEAEEQKLEDELPAPNMFGNLSVIDGDKGKGGVGNGSQANKNGQQEGNRGEEAREI